MKPVGKKETQINLEGGMSPYWLRKMSNATETFSFHYPEILPKHEAEQLCKLLNDGINSSSQKQLQLVSQGLPLLVFPSSADHNIAALIWKDNFILCNRGKASKQPIEVYKFDPNKLTETTFEEIKKLKTKDIQAYERLLFEILPKELDFRPKGNFEKELEDNCSLFPQTVGNCSWVSTETAVWAFFNLKEKLELQNDQLEKSSILNETQVSNYTAEQKFDAWLAFNQIYNLERYLGVRYLRSQDDSEKNEKSAMVRKTHLIDDLFVMSAAARIRRQMMNLKSDNKKGKFYGDLNKILSSSITN